MEALVVEASGSVPTNVGARSDLIRFPTSKQCICHLELVDGCLPARLARKVTRLLASAFDTHADQVLQIEEAVAEIVANAERYAPRPWQLRLYLDGDALWIGVFDGDARTSRVLEDLMRRRMIPESTHERGRGLFLARAACQGACWVRATSSGPTGSGGKEVLLRFTGSRSQLPAA
jgi:anti-sigma regulatory factor (Ser/Thr protein kinase)